MAVTPPSRPGRRGPGRSRPAPRYDTRWRRSRPHAKPVGPAGVAPRPRALAEPPPRAEALDDILAQLTEGWRRGRSPRVEDYLDRLGPCAPDDLVELIYHEFCLAESSGREPDPVDYLHRFPEHRDRLARLFGLHEAIDESRLGRWAEPSPLPGAGDEIGPYRLVRELGRGGLARVFLAEQSDLDDRPVVLKISCRPSPEPRLLARARHSHIVEVLRHMSADDGRLHLICMPFLGGATLSATLGALGPSPATGKDLLAALDRASAPEYPAPERTRPSRDVLAAQSYARAVAWVVARLAEALDHALRRGVVHGDLKPSNILLTADGVPMLFDFNLAVDWSSAEKDAPADNGGTLAYMPPERLRAVADAGPSPASIPRARERHRADIYALGLVLREALTGRPAAVPDRRDAPPRALAAALADARGRDAWTRAVLRGIPAGLRPILARCLAPEPADRYGRASELAEDLDRWRADRPLAFAGDSSWGAGLGRWARRRRVALAAGAAVLLAGAGLAFVAHRATAATLREQATAKLAAILDRAEPGVFRFRVFGQVRDDDREDPAERASRYLAIYDVLGPDDWRGRDDVRALDPGDREDLEAWLLEQSWRLASALRDRPDSPGDWRRGLLALERAAGPSPPGPIATLARDLRRRLERPEPPAVAGRSPRWIEEYLLGVEAEAERAGEALGHYEKALAERPASFWGHYRAASAAWLLGRDKYKVAADHLAYCIGRRPTNPALHVQRAACLFWLDALDEALQECNKSLSLDPDFAEALRNRVYVRSRLDQTDGLAADLDRFALLTRSRGQLPAGVLRLGLLLAPGQAASSDPGEQGELSRRILASDPEAADARATLASYLFNQGRPEAALAEVDRVLQADPDHLHARYQRAVLLYELGKPEGIREMARLVDHPRFEELLAREPGAWRAFRFAVWHYLQEGQRARALQVAERGIESADRLGTARGEARYALAQVYVHGAKDQPEAIRRASDQLRQAFALDRDLPRLFADDYLFDGIRDAVRPRL